MNIDAFKAAMELTLHNPPSIQRRQDIDIQKAILFFRSNVNDDDEVCVDVVIGPFVFDFIIVQHMGPCKAVRVKLIVDYQENPNDTGRSFLRKQIQLSWLKGEFDMPLWGRFKDTISEERFLFDVTSFDSFQRDADDDRFFVRGLCFVTRRDYFLFPSPFGDSEQTRRLFRNIDDKKLSAMTDVEIARLATFSAALQSKTNVDGRTATDFFLHYIALKHQDILLYL